MRRPRLVGLCVGVLMGAVPVLADPPAAFPDEWYFGGPQRPAPLKALEGKPAPALAIDSWIGSEVTLAGSRGKVVVVDFWATWCGPCMGAIPHNVEMVEKYADKGLVFVGVHDSNAGWDSAPKVVKDKGINYPVGVDKAGGASVKDYALQFWPTYVVVDRAGVVRAAGLTPDRVEDVVKALLAEDGPAPGTVAAADEFAPDFYYGGAKRPRAIKALEGTAAPALKGAGWIGKEVSQGAAANSVVVMTFVSPAVAVSMAELDKLLPVEKELAAQNVVFVAVCDGNAWAKAEERFKAKPIAIPIMRDAAGEGAAPAARGVTAAAAGVEMFPTTLVIDRTGKVRAAGVKAAKIKAVVEKLLAETAGVPAPGKE